MGGKLLLGWLIVRPFKGNVGFGYGQAQEEQAPSGPNAGDGGNGDVEQAQDPRTTTQLSRIVR
ncbi:unnamed protein product [Ectocarpus sp. 4 AP-2014]